jgi:hypothetical protein
MTAWIQQDYDRVGDQDADQVTASPTVLGAEYEHGKATAWQLTGRSAEGGQTVGQIEQRHTELNGPAADQGQRTPAESAWHRGYDAGADGSVSLLRDLETADAAGRERELEAG